MNGKVVIGCELETKTFDAQIDYLDEKARNLEKKINDPKKYKIDVTETSAKLEKIRNQIVDLEKKSVFEGLKSIKNIEFNPKTIANISNFKVQGEGLANSFKNLRGELSYIAKDMKDLKIEADDIKDATDGVSKKQNNVNNGLTKTIKKVGKWALAVFGVRSAYSAIRNAMGIISQYEDNMRSNIDYIKYVLAYTLKPIVEWILNAVVKLLQYINYIYKAWTKNDLFKTADAFKQAQKNAKGLNKELDKTTTSFDEMNTLSSSKDSENGIATPDIDLTALPEDGIPAWVEGIKNFGLWVKDNWQTVIGILLGIGVVIILFKLFSKTTKEMVPSITEGANAFLKMAGLALVLSAFALILHEIANLIDVFANSGLKLTDVIGLMATVLGTIIILMGSVALLGPAMTAGILPFLVIIEGLSAILLVMAATLPTILDAVGKFIQQTAPSLCMILTTISNLIKDIILALGTTLPPIIKEVGNVFDTIFNGISKIIESVGDTIVNMMKTADSLINSVLKSILNFINELGPTINKFVDGAIQAVTKLINFVISGIEYMINTLIIDAINSLIAAVNNIPLVNIPEIPRVQIQKFVPKLAKGGIINQPGRGIPIGYGQAIGGENKAEGVIPLTDSQQMQLLGEAIGRYVTINANITNTMNGRVISRELQKVNNTNDFAFNR